MEPLLIYENEYTRLHRPCCTSKLFVSLWCSALIVLCVIAGQPRVTFEWKSAELDWKSQDSVFEIRNHDLFKTYNNLSPTIDQVFWYCDDLTKQQPECIWVTTQTLSVPSNKVAKDVKGCGEIVINTHNENWNKHVDYWSEMVTACRYGLLRIYWRMGELRTPTYDAC